MLTLCIDNLCSKEEVSKSHMIMSALNPEYVRCPEAMYFPEFETVIVEILLLCPFDYI